MTPTRLSPRVALYGRFSSSRQNASSAEDQLRQCDERAKLNGWTVVHRFTDEAISGKDDKRPGYLALQAAVKCREIDVILTESLSRLTRRQGTLGEFYDSCLYHDVKLHTMQEGDITRMHVAMYGAMNAAYLETLADGTHRGLSSVINDGKSAGGRSYGYQVPKHPNGQPKTGELEIVPEEAAIIRRIFTDYARGLSPFAIVDALNSEAVQPPMVKGPLDHKGKPRVWQATTINGNRDRGVGILNNELYVGRRVWNKLRYINVPGTKKRESRLNPESEWKIVDVPQLRIIDDELWQAVKARQAKLDARRDANRKEGDVAVMGNRTNRRPTYLLSGLTRCGCCGGTLNIGGSKPKRLFCSSNKSKGKSICKGIPGIAMDKLERIVLDGLRHHLMQPEAVADFIQRYQLHQKEMDTARQDTLARLRSSLVQTEKEIANIMTAIKAGIFTSTTKAELENLEARKEKLSRDLQAAGQAAPIVPDDLAEVYAAQVEQLVTSLNAPETRSQAADAIRNLIDLIIVHWDEAAGEHAVEIEGKLAELLRAGTNKNAAAFGAAAGSLEMVAGAGFEPATFRL
jgi:site-specific DNA recombinase